MIPSQTRKIGVLAPCMANQSFFCLSSVIVQIAHAFPEAELSMVQLVFTLPCFMITAASLAAGQLARCFSKKALLLAGLTMTMAGGLAGFMFAASLPALLACSAIIGLGIGLNLTLSYAIICDYYDGDERGVLMGWNTAFVCTGGVLFSFLGGRLAAAWGWPAVYLSFLLILPVILLVWLWCPPGLREQAQGRQAGWSTSLYFIVLTSLGVVCYTFQNSFNANSSLYISELGLYTPGLASLSAVLNSAGGILGGLLFGPLLRRLGRQIQSAAYLISSAGFVLLCVLRCLPSAFVSGFVIGFAFALVNAGSSILIADHVPTTSRSMMLAVYNAIVNIGSAVSPYVVNPLARLTDDSAAGRYRMAAAALLLCGGASLLLQRSMGKMPNTGVPSEEKGHL